MCRKNIASRVFETRSLLSIELLFEDSILKNNNNVSYELIPGGGQVPIFVGDKMKFAKQTNLFDIDAFVNFKKLFEKMYELYEQK